MILPESHRILNRAQEYADKKATCEKVKVGSIIQLPNAMKTEIYGCNHGINNCRENGCRRIALYGNNSKEHRLPSDCDSIHSEIDAICKAAKAGFQIRGATIYVTRYPCEACARAIAAAGITKVVYGRKEEISDYTKEILSDLEEVSHVTNWDSPDNNN